jgi:hypothetical protein
VTGLAFSYFDGYQWRADWDSTALGGLPVAVEITLDLQSNLPGTKRNATPDTERFHLTVGFPLAKPIDTSTIP